MREGSARSRRKNILRNESTEVCVRFLLLALSLTLAQLVALTLPAAAQENRFITEASDERLIEVSAMQPGLWLHLEPVDATGMSLEPSRPICWAPCSTRLLSGLWGVSVSPSDGSPVHAPGMITLDRDLHLVLDYIDNSATRIGSGIGVGFGLLYAVGAVIAGSLLPDSSGVNTALTGTGITVGIVALCFLSFVFTEDEARVTVLSPTGLPQ